MTNDLPPVWIVVLNWEDWPATLGLLDTLRSLAYPHRRIVLVDNGSADVPRSRIETMYPEVVLLETEENLGFSRGVNVGIRHSLANGADFIWLLNNDTKPSPAALTELVQTAVAENKAGVVGSAIYDSDRPDHLQSWGGGIGRLWLGYCRHSSGPDDPPEYITGASMLLRKEAIEDSGLFDEGYFFYWEDIDLCARIRAKGWTCIVAPNSRLEHQLAGTAGKHEYNRARWLAAGFVRHLRLHHPLPLAPAISGLAIQLGLRILRLRWTAARGLIQGWLEGWRKPLRR